MLKRMFSVVGVAMALVFCSSSALAYHKYYTVKYCPKHNVWKVKPVVYHGKYYGYKKVKMIRHACASKHVKCKYRGGLYSPRKDNLEGNHGINIH